jgi:small GTP-binding protein domain
MNPSSENPAHARATNESPLSESISIVIAGIRNAGKSSLLNTLFEKEVAIVSPVAGTTTDPVVRKMELPGLGPVAFIDTAGIDDEGELGAMRTQKPRRAWLPLPS